MEDCYNYNRIIEAIEENIHKEDKEIYGLAASAAGLSRREAALIVKCVEGEDYSMYIKRRKTIRCAQQKILDPRETWQNIAVAFAIFEYSTFHRRFKAFLGVAPEDFPEGYRGDVMEMKPGYVGKSNVVVKTETLVKKEIETVTETVYLNTKRETNDLHHASLNRITFEELEMLADGINPLGVLIKEEFGIGVSPISSPAEVRKRLIDIITADTDTKEMLSVHNTIVELEEIRALYGLTFEDVLYLFIKTGKDISKLYDECEKVCDKRIEKLFAEEEYESGWEEDRDCEEDDEDLRDLYLIEEYAYYRGENLDELEDEYNDTNNSIRHLYY